MLDGRVEHCDSTGAGDVQRMTAGSGSPPGDAEETRRRNDGGFPLRVNLPRSHRMMDPHYQEIGAAERSRWSVREREIVAGSSTNRSPDPA